MSLLSHLIHKTFRLAVRHGSGFDSCRSLSDEARDNLGYLQVNIDSMQNSDTEAAHR